MSTEKKGESENSHDDNVDMGSQVDMSSSVYGDNAHRVYDDYQVGSVSSDGSGSRVSEPVNKKSGSAVKLKWEMGLKLIVFLPIIFFIAVLFATLPVVFMSGFDAGNINIGAALLATIVGELIAIGAYIVMTNNMLRNSIKERLGFVNFKWKNIALSAVLGVVMFGLLQLAAIVVDLIFGEGSAQSSDTSTSIFSADGFMGIIVLFVLAPIVAPLVEEILFRGAILNGFLQGGFSKVSAVLISSFAFAILHFQGWSNVADVFTLLWIMFMAIVQGLLFVKTKSLYNNITMHVVYNAVTVFIPLALGAV